MSNKFNPDPVEPGKTPIRKFVINPDRLPARFPHSILIYYVLACNMIPNLWVYIIGGVILLIALMLYFYRKSIEIPNKTS